MAAAKLCEKAGTLHITIEQGATFDPSLTWRDQNGALIDLSGFAARMQVRATVEDAIVLLEATSANGKLVVGGASGTITFNVPAVETAALDFETAVYDLEVESGSGVVTRLLKGDVFLSLEVTR